MTDNRFAGKVVVIAGTGYKIDRNLADHFRQEGAQVSVFSSVELGTPTALVSELVQARGHIDVWVNCNRGFAPAAVEAETMLPEVWDQTLSRTLSTTFYCAQAAGQQMLKQQSGGVIVNVTSTDAYQITEGRVALSMAAAGIVALTEALGIEWAKRGVRVAGIALGAVEQMVEHDASQATLERRTPLHRLGTADEISEAILFLASDQASYIVGETLRVDGGWTAYQLF